MTAPSPAEWGTVLAALRASLPQTDGAYQEPGAGWLAQRIVGACAVIEQAMTPSPVDAVCAGQNTPPPPLPAEVPAFGDEWRAAATTWLEVAAVLQRSDAEDLHLTADRLTEYAVTQQQPTT
ncbi:hypothetical protein FIV07_28250 (plasmid) [Mycobacterium sp. THAF192]|nr:hypothetical protein FIV07_28250 [Mycobacterium sp. THAF192]